MPSGSAPTPGPLTREVGAILRARVARLNLTLSDLTEASGVSVPQLSRMLRGLARIDLEQFAAICERLGLRTEDVWAEAKGEAPEVTPLGVSSAELIRRIHFLIDRVTAGDRLEAYHRIEKCASTTGQDFSRSDLGAFLGRKGRRPSVATLNLISSAMEVDDAYFRVNDHDAVRQIEVELRFKLVARDSGLVSMAARGELTTEALEAIADLMEEENLKRRGQ
jgi:transcriptional regulator with XRE-family HTH domain